MSLSAAASPRAGAATGLPDIAHVGYHRTGTNYFQKQVFPALDGQLFRPRGSGWRFFDAAEAFDEAGARAYYEAEARNNLAGLPVLISSERLSGTEEADDLSVPEKLHRLNPAMRVVVVLRAQPDIFRSLYHLHVKAGGTLSLADFIERLIEARRCDYAAMVGRLTGLFGRESVLVLLYEDLRADPEAFVGAFCDFAGIGRLARVPAQSVNAAGSPSELRLRRRLNQAGGAGPLGRIGLKLARKADDLAVALAGRPLAPLELAALRPRIAAACGAGNRALAERLGRPLGELGYPL